MIFAADNPLNNRYSAVVLAGLSAEATYHAAGALLRHGQRGANVLLLPHGAQPRSLALPGGVQQISVK